MNTELVDALTKALANAQRELESERARSEQLVARLHQAGRREQQYIEVIAGQNELIALLEGQDLGVSDARLERRERAKRRVADRTGDRHDS